MKVYVITNGDYSDYHICGVALDIEKAKILKRAFTSNWDEARIEEYDTDDHKPIFEGKIPYEVRYFKNGDISSIREVELDYFDGAECRSLDPFYNHGANILVKLYAKNQEAAIKIASEKRAEFLAKKNGL